MAVPDRPVSHASIESVWGQQIHDYTFAPAGCKVHGGSTDSVGTTAAQLDLDVADDDPGGYLNAANDRIVFPSNSGGLYVVQIVINSVNGTADDTDTRGYLMLNGTAISVGLNTNAGATNVVVPIFWLGEFVAGDILTVMAQRRGTGSNPTVQVGTFNLVRIGFEFGAPS
jgi:hypothetical protein